MKVSVTRDECFSEVILCNKQTKPIIFHWKSATTHAKKQKKQWVMTLVIDVLWCNVFKYMQINLNWRATFSVGNIFTLYAVFTQTIFGCSPVIQVLLLLMFFTDNIWSWSLKSLVPKNAEHASFSCVFHRNKKVWLYLCSRSKMCMHIKHEPCFLNICFLLFWAAPPWLLGSDGEPLFIWQIQGPRFICS